MIPGATSMRPLPCWAMGPLPQAVQDLNSQLGPDPSAFNRLALSDHDMLSSQARLWQESPVSTMVNDFVAWLAADPMHPVTFAIVTVGASLAASIARHEYGRSQMRKQLDLYNADVAHRPAAESLLGQIYHEFSGRKNALDFIEQYAGPRDLFHAYVQYRLDWLRQIKSGEVTEEVMGQLLPEGEVRNRWNVLRAHGWTIHFDKKSGIRLDKQVIVVAKVITYTHPAIDFYRDVKTQELQELRNHKRDQLLRRIKQITAPPNGWDSRRDPEYSLIVDYLIERDAFRFSLEYYRQLRNEHPEVRTRHYEAAVASPGGAQEMIEELKKRHSHLNSKQLTQLDPYSLKELSQG